MLLNEDIERVKSQISMRDIANYYGMRVNRKGFALCPFHNDKHPSMQIFSGYTKKDGFYCRSCGTGGTIFSFVMQYENLEFKDSVRKIATIFGIPIKDKEEITPEDTRKMSFQRMQAMLNEEESKVEQYELICLAESIHLFEDVMHLAKPFSRLFCEVAHQLPILQGEWDERFAEYCDKR